MKTKILIILIVVVGLGIGGYLYWQGQKQIIEGEWFQSGNTQDIIKFQTKKSEELEDNRMGGMWRADVYTKDDLDWFVNDISELGPKRIRLTFDWFDWNEIGETGEYSKHDINPYQDKAIKGLADKGMKITYVLVFWDPESPSFKEEDRQDYSRFKTEEEIQHYLDYVQFMVSNLKDHVEYFEILNESNHCEGTQQYVKLEDYINLVKRVVPVIRQEDPEAKIIVGAVADLRQPPFRKYIFDLIKSDIMPLVNAISFHAMYGTSPEYVFKQYYYDYPSFIQEIKDVASFHGFKGEYMSDELTWRTAGNPHPDEVWTYSEMAAAKYYARGTIINLGLDMNAGLGELDPRIDLPRMRVVQNLSIVMAGNSPIDLPIEIQSEATNIKNYSFSLSNGDKLIALWTDGVAVDDDPGINTTLTIPNFSAQKVIGIDVLNGYQQSITTSNENGNLVIQNLIVRDYPLILRIK